jgi:hypothetical protein
VKQITRIAFVVAVAILISLNRIGAPDAILVAAQGTGPTMQVTAGFDGYCRHRNNTGWCPIHVVLANEDVDVEGELRVSIGSGSSQVTPNVYARRVHLAAHSRKAYFLHVPAMGFLPSRLEVELVDTGDRDELLAVQRVPVVWLDESSRLYGVASGDPSSLNFLSDVAPAGGKASVAHLDLDRLSPDPLGWEGIDVLILNDVDTTALDGDRRQALDTWVSQGGHLIVGGGAGVARTVAGVADLLPVTVGAIRSVDDLWALGEQVGVTPMAGPYPVAGASLGVGEVLVAQKDAGDDLILLARRAYGGGTVDFLAFDAGLNPFARWDDNGRLWESIVEVGGAGARRFSVQNGHSAREAINTIPGLELPSTLQILGFMLAYTILIGPVNYVVLRRLDRRELAWLTIPVLILTFSGCAYVTGFQIRGGRPIVHQLAVVTVPEGTTTGRVSEVVGLFSPRRTTYDVWVTGSGVREISDAYYGGPVRQPLVVVEEAGGSTLTGLRVDVGGIQPFMAEGYAEMPAVTADLQLSIGETGTLQVEGTLRNGGVRLENAVLIVGNHEQRLGDLEAGEEAKVRIVYGVQPYSQVGIPEQVLGPGNYWEDRELYRRHQFLQALFPYDGRGGPTLGKGVYLLGWADEAPLTVEVVGRPFSAFETVLYVYALPVVGLETGTVVTIPEGLISREVEETSGDVNVWTEGLRMNAGATVVFRYTIWSEVAVRQVDELVLELEGSSYGSRVPAVSLWNQEKDEWERLNVGWGKHTIPAAGAYVLEPGEVLLRLETDSEWPAEVGRLAITLKGRR